MPTVLAVLMSASDAVTWEALAWFMVKLTLIAGLGLAIVAGARRASAAVRHLAAIATLAALLAMPIATVWLPAWRWAILPAPAATRWKVTTQPQLAPGATSDPSSFDAVITPASDASAPQTLGPTPATAGSPARPFPRVPLPAVAAVLLLLVASGLIARLVFGSAAIGWILCRAPAVEDSAVLAEFERARRRLGVRDDVRLAICPRTGVPAVAGWWHPTLILPPEAMTWDMARLRAVFLHELAHIRRGDALSLLIGELATSLYWFHPLTWVLARQGRRESERACDDVVLGNGERATEYAEHLLRIATAAGARDPLAGLTLAAARRSSLEGRLVAILSADVKRGPASRRVVTTIAVVATLLLLSAATVRVVAAPARLEIEPAPTAEGPVSDAISNEMTPTPFTESGIEKMETKTRTTQSKRESVKWQSSDSKSGERWYDQAHELYSDERYGEAGDMYHRAAEEGYREETAYYNAACSYALDGQKDRAIDELTAAIEAGWDDAEKIQSDDDLDAIRGDRRYVALIRGLPHTREEKEARDEATRRGRETAKYHRLRDSGSRDASEWGSVGIALMRSGAHSEAIDAFQRQQRLEPKSSTLYNLACAYATAGDRAHALDALQQAVEAGYGDADHMKDDDDLQALHGDARFRQLVKLTEDLEIYNHGRDDNDVEGWRDVLPDFERTARQHASLGRAWFNLGYVRLRAEDPRGSREAFDRALQLGYRPTTTMYNLGCASAQLSDDEQALQWLEKAEAAGMDLSNALDDRDLDSLHRNARFRAMVDRARRSEKEKQRSGKD